MARPNILDTFRAYIALTKPRVISLLLVTTFPAMLVAERGWPSGWLILATLAGGSLSAGGANAINCWYDRDIDSVMKRTRSRPIVTGEVAPAHGLAFGILLGAGAFVFLWATTTRAAAVLSLAALLFYVFVYTMWLKRRTPQNIVIGGAAGAFPPMVGWAAVTGDVSWGAVVMFAIIFMWTPPHFWALSLRLRDDYADAGVPMLPVTNGVRHTRVQIVLYSIALVPVTLLLVPTGDLGWIYLATAAVGGVAFLWKSYELWKRPADVSPISVYKFSMLYLAILFMAMGIDAVVLS
ncbi:MAG: protoheme IX farnesyltransferase [Dehalococcoidia bacterium]|nr:protoheme IX farnesyltransferase [Dehalococcoidia bacterium]